MEVTDNLLQGLIEFFQWAFWLVLLAFGLVIADLKFGLDAAKNRKEQVKKSRAIRRTMDKICSYVMWIVLAYFFGKAFGTPFGIDLLPLIILLVIYGVELESIYVNYFAAKGKKVKINILKFFGKKADIIEFEQKEDENEND